MSKEPAESVVSGGIVAVDLSCKRCGYNLRGLPEGGRCPECATPIGLAIRGSLLRFSDPRWIGRVAQGLRILVWSMPLWVVAAIAAGTLSAWAHPVYAHVITLGVSVVGFVGAWLITLPDPSGYGEDPHLTARKAIRVALVFGMLSDLAEIFSEAFPSRPMIMTALTLLGAATALVWVWGEFAKFSYCEVLARRVPDEALVRRARWIKWGYTISLAAVSVLTGAMALMMVLGGAALMPATAPAAATAYTVVSEVEVNPPPAASASSPVSQPVRTPIVVGDDDSAGDGALPVSRSGRVRTQVSAGRSGRAVVMTNSGGRAAGPPMSPGLLAFLTISGCVTGVASIAFMVYAVLAFFFFRRLAARVQEQAAEASAIWTGELARGRGGG